MTRKARDPRLDSDDDFVLSSKHGNSLRRLMEDYPDGAPDGVICKTLDLTPEALQETYDRAILKLRQAVCPPESLLDDDEL